MAWTKLDDHFWSNPKMVSLSPHAFRLYVRSLNWSVANLTDGHVPVSALPLFGDMRYVPKWAEELCSANVWKCSQATWQALDKRPSRGSQDQESGEKVGFEIHDYAVYQPTKKAIEQLQQQGRDRQQRYRDRQKDQNVTRHSRVSNAFVTRGDPTPLPLANAKGAKAGEVEDPKPRKNDPMFSALWLAIIGSEYAPGDSDKLTKSGRGEFNKAAKELREIGASASEVAGVAEAYRQEWPNVTISASAIAKNWHRFTGLVVDQCGHRWSDGRTAWSTSIRAGEEITRCDKCAEVQK